MIQRMMSLLRLFSSAMQGSTTHLKSQFKCQLNSHAVAYGFACRTWRPVALSLTISRYRCLRSVAQRIGVSLRGSPWAENGAGSNLVRQMNRESNARIIFRQVALDYSMITPPPVLLATGLSGKLRRAVPSPKCAKYCSVCQPPGLTPQLSSPYVGRTVASISSGFGTTP